MFDAIILAAVGTIWERLGVFAVCLAFGILMLATGIRNVKTQTAEESGKARVVNKLLGASNSYDGKKAVLIGWVRIATGVGAIIFGIVFLFTGPLLARK